MTILLILMTIYAGVATWKRWIDAEVMRDLCKQILEMNRQAMISEELLDEYRSRE